MSTPAHIVIEHELDVDPDTTVLLRVFCSVVPGLCEIAGVMCDGKVWEKALPPDARESIYALALDEAENDNYQQNEWGCCGADGSDDFTPQERRARAAAYEADVRRVDMAERRRAQGAGR